MRRTLPLLLLALLAAGPALAQSQGGVTSFGLGAQGLQGGGRSVKSGATGPDMQRPPPPNTPVQGTYSDMAGCAPGQASVNRGGCQSQDWIAETPRSTYDQSIEAMSPLRDLKLD